MFERTHQDYTRHGSTVFHGGFWALTVYRFGRWSLERRSRTARWATSKVYAGLKVVTEVTSGVTLDRTTTVGEDLHLIHAGMISIHPDAIIGDRVGIMHGVTIGTNMGVGVPTIGNDVFIGCNASVLGKVKVGDGARIAANSLVISDVPPGAVAIGVPAKVVPDLSRLRDKQPTIAIEGTKSAQPSPVDAQLAPPLERRRGGAR